MIIGNNIKKYRKEAKLTQKELAKKIGVLDHHIARWEKGTYTPSLEYTKKISKALQVSIDDLVLSTKEKKNIKASDKKLLDKLNRIDQLPPEHRATIADLIDKLLK